MVWFGSLVVGSEGKMLPLVQPVLIERSITLAFTVTALAQLHSRDTRMATIRFA